MEGEMHGNPHVEREGADLKRPPQVDMNMNSTVFRAAVEDVTSPEPHTVSCNNKVDITAGDSSTETNYKTKTDGTVRPLSHAHQNKEKTVAANLAANDQCKVSVTPTPGVVSSSMSSPGNGRDSENLSSVVNTRDVSGGSGPAMSPGVTKSDSTSQKVDSTSSASLTSASPQQPKSAKTGGSSTPGQKKRKRRGSAWSDEQTEFLMEIWARHAEQKDAEDTNSNHHTPVYRVIAEAMAKQGDPKTWEQCKTRIHTLKRAYKQRRDEIRGGLPCTTFCRHFDKLEIIMGDSETTTPQMLADLLEMRRKHNRENAAKATTTPQKRTQPASDKSSKRANTKDNSDKSLNSSHSYQMQSGGSLVGINPQESSNYIPSSPQVQYHQQQPAVQQASPRQPAVLTAFQQPETPATYASPSIMPQQFINTPTNLNNALGMSPEINNNETVLKQERHSGSSASVTFSTISAQPWAPSHTPQKEELEKMRLDLEIRKIDMERNRLEMEERQRREERDHQYRMLQLLMFGLGQQSSASVTPGQTPEHAVAQAHSSTNLSRALENGLVPGGTYTANEKGLSFSEI